MPLFQWIKRKHTKSGLLLVCGGVLPADFVADVLKSLILPSQPSLFFFGGEVQFPLQLGCFLLLFRELLLQSPREFLEKMIFLLTR